MDDLTISHLLNPDKRSWNENIIHAMFNQWDSILILSLPLNERRPNDEMFCWFEKWGQYVVKLGYHTLHSSSLPIIPEVKRRVESFMKVDLTPKILNFT